MGNETQDTSTSSGLLIALCILTILGSIFGILRGFLYEFGALVFSGGHGEETYVRGWLYGVFHTGTLTGAIIMLCRSMVGLYMYSISQIPYIVFVLYTSCVTYGAELLERGDGEGIVSVLLIGAFFWLPSLVFLILYWIPPIRKCLK